MSDAVFIGGASSRIAHSFQQMVVDNHEDVRLVEVPLRSYSSQYAADPTARRFVFFNGLLEPRTLAERAIEPNDGASLARSFMANCGCIVQYVSRVLEVNPYARICVVGSMSADKESYDGAYTLGKAALHRYVETKQLQHPHQQLVAVAPGMIADAGMTTRRQDRENVERYAQEHPKRRLLTSLEVAQMIYHLLYVDKGYTSNTVVKMYGRPESTLG